MAEHAVTSDARGITRTFVWTEYDSTKVIGYYSMLAHVLRRDQVPKSVGRGGPREIPAILLARLALDRSAQGRGIGGALLGDAMERALLAADQVGARFLVVDALSERATAFYVGCGFKRIPDSMRLVLKFSDIAAAVQTVDARH